jgi:DNA-binding NarL/FixJ family response regulator
VSFVSTPVRVLVVDDHDLVAHGLALLLDSAEDLSVVGRAGTVADAVRTAAATHPDVVLIDYNLPDGSGVQAAGPRPCPAWSSCSSPPRSSTPR